MNWSASWRKLSRASSISARVSCFRDAMAVLSCCTSRGERWRNTSAAASSPKDIIKIALRSMESSGLAVFIFFIFVQPGAQHHSHGTWVIVSHRAGGVQILFVAAHFGGTLFSSLFASRFFFLALDAGVSHRLGLDQALDDGVDDDAPCHEQNECKDQILDQFHSELAVLRIFPEGGINIALLVELSVHHAQAIASISRVTHGLFDQIADLVQFFLLQRLLVLVRIAIVHHHGYRQAA